MNTIKYINIAIEAEGMGCVNTNGSINPETGESGLYMSDIKKIIDNFIYPKARNGQMYISNNCIRSAIWKNEIEGIMLGANTGFKGANSNGSLKTSNKSAIDMSQLFASTWAGLLRGYMLTTKSSDTVKRSSPLYVSDFINTTKEVNEMEVGVNQYDREDGKKGSTSLFYTKTWGKTKYEGQMCIDIDALRYISLDNRLDSPSLVFNYDPKNPDPSADIEAFQNRLVMMLHGLADKFNMSGIKDKVTAKHGLYEMSNLFVSKCEGIVLSDEAVHLLVLETLDHIRKLHIVKSRAFMRVTDMKVTAQSEFNFEGVTFDENTVYPYYSKFQLVA